MEIRGQLAGTSSFHLFPFLLPQGYAILGEAKVIFQQITLVLNNDNTGPTCLPVYWFLLLSTFLDYGRYIMWTIFISWFLWVRVSCSWEWLWLLISLLLLPSAWITCMRHCCVVLSLLRWDTDGLFILDRKTATEQSNGATMSFFWGGYWLKYGWGVTRARMTQRQLHHWKSHHSVGERWNPRPVHMAYTEINRSENLFQEVWLIRVSINVLLA